MTTQKYLVTGMTCGHCVNHIKAEVSAIAGVSEVEISLSEQTMVVTSNEPIAFQAISEAVDEAGDYQVQEA